MTRRRRMTKITVTVTMTVMTTATAAEDKRKIIDNKNSRGKYHGSFLNFVYKILSRQYIVRLVLYNKHIDTIIFNV